MEKDNKPLIIAAVVIGIVLITSLVLIFSRSDSETESLVTSNASKNEQNETEKEGNNNSDQQPTPQPEPEPESQPIPEPSPTETPEEYLVFNGNQFNQLFLKANLDNLASQTVEPPTITGDEEIDQRLRTLAEARGWRLRPEVLDRSQLVFVEGQRHLLQPRAAKAYLELKAAAATVGHHIQISSAFRSYDTQRQIFLNHVGAPYAEAEVNEFLRLRSLPGYSKHHTGYTVDIGEGSLVFSDFERSASYAWLAADNYLNAKKFGWIPSYPPDAQLQGPDPEVWEFTFVGKEYLLKD